MTLHPQLKETEKVSVDLIDQLTGVKNDISDNKLTTK